MEPAIAKVLSDLAHAPGETAVAIEMVLKALGLASLVDWLSTHPKIAATAILIVGIVWANSSKTTSNGEARGGASDQSVPRSTPLPALTPDPAVAEAETRSP